MSLVRSTALHSNCTERLLRRSIILKEILEWLTIHGFQIWTGNLSICQQKQTCGDSGADAHLTVQQTCNSVTVWRTNEDYLTDTGLLYLHTWTWAQREKQQLFLSNRNHLSRWNTSQDPRTCLRKTTALGFNESLCLSIVLPNTSALHDADGQMCWVRFRSDVLDYLRSFVFGHKRHMTSKCHFEYF